MQRLRGRQRAWGSDVRRRGGAALAVTVLTAAALTGTVADTATAAPGAGPAAGPDRTGWHSSRAAGPERDEDLRAVAALGSRDAWSVGYREQPSGTDVPVAEHFDGAVWRATAVPAHRPPGTAEPTGQLTSVLPLSARDVWAVGSWNDAAAFQDRSLAEHFDGRRWREVPLPAEAADRSAYPTALAGSRADDLWAVGGTAQDRISAPRPLAYHWNGSAWSAVDTPDTGGDALLLGAAADRRGGVWAVGVGYDAKGEGHPLTEHWDGTAWRIVPAPHTTGRGETLESVAVLGPDEVWAVGATATPDGVVGPLALHWDGRTWRAAAVPDVRADLHSVTAYGRDGLLVVGEQQGAATPAFTMRWDGAAWHTEPAATDPAGRGASLFSVAAVPGTRTAWSVGSTLPQFDPPWRPIVQEYAGPPAN
ncbi:hypothetical protein SAMN05216251_10446 [Actinacidiphila alni]|uniref:Galactose oxidase n=1 Tax=Actinacidiphila alni TaxID=380248 RepID=A0A1I2BWV0_9ACTN|nr:hypothetical protein [Actinacidiphila alni]SFE60462.1 hypothetical protein SAMN05216251_10446 [Actinacidiphila alni]